MPEQRISHIELDDATIIWRSADVEQERRIAIFDLIEENTFKPVRLAEDGGEGPWRLRLAVTDGRVTGAGRMGGCGNAVRIDHGGSARQSFRAVFEPLPGQPPLACGPHAARSRDAAAPWVRGRDAGA